MKKALLISVIVSISTLAYSQESINALYPPELLIESLCPVDSGFFAHTVDTPWDSMYFTLTDYTDGRLPYKFTEMATDPNFSVYRTESLTDFYPYDIESYRKSDSGSLFLAFGGDTLITIRDDEEVKLVMMPDTLEILAVNFIEEWQLDTVKLSFRKNVKAIVPIRCYTAPQFDKEIFRRTCIIAQNRQANNNGDPILIARVKYESRLFQQDENTKGILPGEELFNMELAGSPFLSSYSRKMLIRFLERSALKNRVKCYDFRTGNAVIDTDIIMKGFGYSRSVIKLDLGGGEFNETEIVEKTRYINSVIFYEEWYIDSKTGQFSKKVTAIAPVLWDLNEKRKAVELFVRFDED